MDYQILSIILAILTTYLAVRNYITSNRKDIMRESQEMTEIKVQLNQVMGMLQDVQKDIRNNAADYHVLNERVIKLETKLDTALKQIDELKGGNDGK